jgi:steroid delta-isomerase
VTPNPELEPAPPMRKAAARVVDFFESLTPASLDRLDALYAPEAYFKDPFNEVRGVPAIRQVFDHMYESLAQPRFVVTGCIVDGAECFLTWNFHFHFRRFDTRALQTVRGGSHLKFNPAGLLAFHRDYWDAAEELYEKLPLVGPLMHWLKKRARQ